MADAEPLRTQQFFRYLIHKGAADRWGPTWAADEPERMFRLVHEISVVESMGFCSYFLILARIMQFCRDEGIVYGPGRGSVGGSLAAYCMGIHEIDSLEFDLYFERFLNPDRVAYPDVDIDVSQRHRPRVLKWIKKEFEDDETAVLQVAAFARAGARSTIDMVATALHEDPDSGAIAESLKRLLPEGSNITGGTKQDREIEWWLENGKNSKNQNRFREMAEGAGWMELLLKLDGIQTHLAKHAAGVVIISKADLARLPQTSADGVTMMTGYDMYSLDDLKYLKIDILGLRTLDIVSDAHKFCGGDGSTPALMELWRTQRDRPEPYDLLCDADTLGVFQVETSGYRKTLKEFQPRRFDHIVQLNALYRPGALDSKRDDGKNMVEVFIERMHGREAISYPMETRDRLAPILAPTQGILLYQEQSMAVARDLAGFSITEADNLRKAIGKKQLDRMAEIKPEFIKGMLAQGFSQTTADRQFGGIAASARYSWNKSHSVFYGAITWMCAFFKAMHHVHIPELGLDGPGKAAFYAGLINSLDEDKNRQADAVAEARQHVNIRPPDINVAEVDYTVADGAVVFGLNGIKGMGEANRNAIILERLLSGPFKDFASFHARLPSVPINMKLSLIRCGAFDSTEIRAWLLASVPKPTPKQPDRRWTVAECIKHNASLKKPKALPDMTECSIPSERELAQGEMETIGFYVSHDPMAEVNRALKRLDTSKFWGGEIVAGSLMIKVDKREQEYGRFTLLTHALNKQRCMVFGSDWPQCKHLIKPGERVVCKGYMDGSQLIVEAVFTAGDYRQFKILKLTRDGTTKIENFEGDFATVELAEQSGYTVQLL